MASNSEINICMFNLIENIWIPPTLFRKQTLHKMFHAKLLTAYILLLSIFLVTSSRTFKFTNLKCEDHDPDFARFEVCQLSVKRRGIVSLDITCGIYKPPVTNVSVSQGWVVSEENGDLENNNLEFS